MALSRPRPWIAALLALPCSGLGHVYAGRIGAGIAIHLGLLAVGVAVRFALPLGLGVGMAGVAIGLGLWGAQAALAARAARNAGDEPRRWLSRAPGLALLLVLSLASSRALDGVLQARASTTVAASTASMAPTILPGDYLVVASGGRIERGEVVVHEVPPFAPRHGQSVKRVVAVGGDTVEIRDGRLVLNGEPAEREAVPGPCQYQDRDEGGSWRQEPCLEFVEKLDGRAYHTYCTPGTPCGDVPPQRVQAGTVFVVGDHRDHSADSRVFGPVPVSRIVGRAAYLYASAGPSGVRWDRIGRPVR